MVEENRTSPPRISKSILNLNSRVLLFSRSIDLILPYLETIS